MAIDDRAVATVVLVVGYAIRWLAQQLGERRLALLDRRPPQILAVELEEVEGA